MPVSSIQLRGVSVHNLKQVDLDLPHRHLIVFCGVSGSGKTSLALDTLYAEGQRRYIESFSVYTRQFLQQLEKPDAESIDKIPPAIAVTRSYPSTNRRSTVGTATEIVDYLRLLFAKIGQQSCHQCGRGIQLESPETIAQQVETLPPGTRYMIGAATRIDSEHALHQTSREWRQQGLIRALLDGKIIELTRETTEHRVDQPTPLVAIVDRLTVDRESHQRLLDSLESALELGRGTCQLFVQADSPPVLPGHHFNSETIDGRTWHATLFSRKRRCETCQIDLPDPQPQLYSFNSPMGACPTCEGFGSVSKLDMELIVPDPSKTIREGAIAPWNTPAYAHELQELLALAEDYDLPTHIPYHQLETRHLKLIQHGVAERDFGGLDGFFAWLEKRKYKMHLRVFLSRWRSYDLCPDCQGMRLKPESLATTVDGWSIAQMCTMKVHELKERIERLELSPWQQQVARLMQQEISARLGYLCDVGLGYLTLDRPLRTLSGGEAQRVALTSALGATLVNMLYVLDEPTVGLHACDVDRLIRSIQNLRDRKNTVVVVEHEPEMINAAQQVVEIGPAAGESGGRVVFQGTPDELHECEDSVTADFLCGRRGLSIPAQRRPTQRGWIKLVGARGNNLQNLTVEFPLGVLCLVTGVSGAGKSTLVQDTLYGAVCRRKKKECDKPMPYDDLFGDGQINDVLLIDQSPIGRSPRSNPVTYIKAFDEIRSIFASTVDAKARNYPASHFSFNLEGGRCPKCKGDGYLAVDMQFLADTYMKCNECQGARYRKEILSVTYRGKRIVDVLNMTVREAFSFFRGQTKLQAKLKRLIDVGLEYLRLGQPATTLSAGEAQRLKLASYLTTAKRGRTLFLLDEPTTGLHFADVVKLLDCFDALLSVGHSLLVVEHNLQVMRAADYLIDLGPGAAEAGGQVVVQGTPEQVALHPESITGRFLDQALKQAALS